MAGRVLVMGPRGLSWQYETKEQAQNDWQHWIDEQMILALVLNNLRALGHAMHAKQDYYAFGHRFKPWFGYFRPGDGHVYGDAHPNPLDEQRAIGDTFDLAQQFAAVSPWCVAH